MGEREGREDDEENDAKEGEGIIVRQPEVKKRQRDFGNEEEGKEETEAKAGGSISFSLARRKRI